jgi:hypothetical protein
MIVVMMAIWVMGLEEGKTMLIKSLIAAAAVSTGIALSAGAADARTNITIGVGIPGPIYAEPGYDYPPQPPVYYYDEPRPVYYYPRYRVSCGQAARALRHSGYRHIEPQDCSGRRYSFIAWRQGHPYVVSVSSRTGRIIGRSRL